MKQIELSLRFFNESSIPFLALRTDSRAQASIRSFPEFIRSSPVSFFFVPFLSYLLPSFFLPPFEKERGRKLENSRGGCYRGGRVSGGSGVGRDKRAKLLGPARLEICKSGVIRLDIRSVHGTMLALVSSTLRGRGEGGGDGCAESGPSPLFEPTSALFRDVINGLCSYNLALLLRGLFTDTTRPLSLSVYLPRHERIERGIPIVPEETSFLLPPFLSFPFLSFLLAALKGLSRLHGYCRIIGVLKIIRRKVVY